jgi:hypothetical protein
MKSPIHPNPMTSMTSPMDGELPPRLGSRHRRHRAVAQRGWPPAGEAQSTSGGAGPIHEEYRPHHPKIEVYKFMNHMDHQPGIIYIIQIIYI